MRVINRGTATSTSNSTTCTVTPPVPSANSYVLFSVGCATSALVVTGVTGTNGTTGYFTRLGSATNSAVSVETWLGYGFDSTYPSTFLFRRSAGTVNWTVTARTIDIFGNCFVVPSSTGCTSATGTSASAAAPVLTPATGDVLFASYAVPSTSVDPTSWVSSGNIYFDNFGEEISGVRTGQVYCDAYTGAASSVYWNLAGSSAWASIHSTWSVSAASGAATAGVVKGLDTSVDDEASSF
jgi:hypothetical protein